MSAEDHLTGDPTITFTGADLSAVHSTYHSDRGRTGSFLRYPAYLVEGETGFGTFQDVAPGARTEYVAYRGPRSGGIPQWMESYLGNGLADVDDSMTFSNGMSPVIYRKGDTRTVAWGQGPLGAGVPHQNDDNGGLCFMCRGKNSMNLLMAPFLDSAGHFGNALEPTDAITDARFRLYLGSKKIADVDGLPDISSDLSFIGNSVKVGAKHGTFKAVFDVDRRLQDPRLSTRSQTTVKFASARDQGKRPPQDWYCLASVYNCRVLPVLTAKVNLPTGVDGSLPAGKSTVTVKVARVQHAAGSAVKSTKLQVRFRNGDWTTVKLTTTGKGVYTGTMNNSKFAGQIADLHVVATDAGGSSFEQTILRAFSVAG